MNGCKKYNSHFSFSWSVNTHMQIHFYALLKWTAENHLKTLL